MGAYPKPSLRAKLVKSLIKLNKDPYVILLSGTPTPESYSQMYHQVYAIERNPFKQYKSFYKFSHQYVNITQKKIGPTSINDYSDGKESILYEMKPYMISWTQKEAGFETQITEEILTVLCMNPTHNMVKKLKKESLARTN